MHVEGERWREGWGAEAEGHWEGCGKARADAAGKGRGDRGGVDLPSKLPRTVVLARVSTAAMKPHG